MQAASEHPVLTSSSDEGNQWYLNDSPISGATSKTFTVAEVGTYKVRVTLDNCSSQFSAALPIVILGDIDTETPFSFIQTNPVSDILTLDLSSFNEETNVDIAIYDMTGRVIRRLTEKEKTVSITVREFSSGVYILRACQPKKVLSMRFLKE